MDGMVPGFVPRVLSDHAVGLFRADERAFDAMIAGWRAQMLARGLTVATIEGRCRLVRRFREFTGEFPWQWGPVDIEEFLAERPATTRRSCKPRLGIRMPRPRASTRPCHRTSSRRRFGR